MALGVVTVFGLLMLAAPIFLTAWGAHRRGRSHLVSIASGLVFPFTWAAWYVVDERPISKLTSAR